MPSPAGSSAGSATPRLDPPRSPAGGGRRRTQLRWRFRSAGRAAGARLFIVEQAAYADVDDSGRIADLDLVCTGYLRRPPMTEISTRGAAGARRSATTRSRTSLRPGLAARCRRFDSPTATTPGWCWATTPPDRRSTTPHLQGHGRRARRRSRRRGRGPARPRVLAPHAQRRSARPHPLAAARRPRVRSRPGSLRSSPPSARLPRISSTSSAAGGSRLGGRPRHRVTPNRFPSR